MEKSTHESNPKYEAYMLKSAEQYDAVVLYDNLIHSFITTFGEKDGQPGSYPDNYAGAYVNSDGKLVIQVKVGGQGGISRKECIECYSNFIDFKRLKSNYAEIKSDSISDVVLFEDADFSLNELNIIFDKAIEKFDYPSVSSGVDTRNNTVKFGLELEVYEQANKELEAIKAHMKDVLDIPWKNRNVPFVFETEERGEFMSRHIGGRGPYLHRTTAQLRDGVTLGFAGRQNNRNSYLTCGHGAVVGNIARFNGPTSIGTVDSVTFSDGSLGDFAIISLASGETN